MEHRHWAEEQVLPLLHETGWGLPSSWKLLGRQGSSLIAGVGLVTCLQVGPMLHSWQDCMLFSPRPLVHIGKPLIRWCSELQCTQAVGSWSQRAFAVLESGSRRVGSLVGWEHEILEQNRSFSMSIPISLVQKEKCLFKGKKSMYSLITVFGGFICQNNLCAPKIRKELHRSFLLLNVCFSSAICSYSKVASKDQNWIQSL